MEKTYLKNGNSTTRGNHYCMKHFIEVHKRGPGIFIEVHKRGPGISDKACFRECIRCVVLEPHEWD